MNKRGSHIDVIISFIIFVSFIVFFYFIIQPSLTPSQDKSDTTQYVFNQLTKNMSGNLTSIQILTNYQGGSSNHLDLIGMLSSLNALGIGTMNLNVTNSTGKVFPAYYNGNDLYIDTSSGSQNQMVFYLYYSPQFNLLPSGTLSGSKNLNLNANTNYYEIGTVQDTNSDLFDFNIVNFIQAYDNGYNTIKNSLKLSPTDNFGFNFTYQNQTSISTNDSGIKSRNVYSQSFPIIYLNGNSSLQSGNLIIRVW